MERSRRCASTVKPPTETRAMRSIPSTSAAREIVSGLSGFDWATEAGVCTSCPDFVELSGTPGASKSAMTWVGAVTCPGATSANSSRRLWGFSTMPTTRRSTPPTLPGVADLEVEVRSHAAGHGDLVGARRVVPGDEREHRAAEGSVRVLGAELERVDRSGDRHVSFSMTSTRPEAVLEPRDLARDCALLGKVPNPLRCRSRSSSAGGVLVATAEPTMVAATATAMRARIRNCWRHSRRNRRQAQRTTARRAGRRRRPDGSSASGARTAVLIDPPLVLATVGAHGSVRRCDERLQRPRERSGRRCGRRAGRRRDRPTRRGGRRG